MLTVGYALRGDGRETVLPGTSGDRKKAGSASELEREAFRMVSGGEDGCKLARDQDLQKEVLDLL